MQVYGITLGLRELEGRVESVAPREVCRKGYMEPVDPQVTRNRLLMAEETGSEYCQLACGERRVEKASSLEGPV